jgi:hypothetical protein
MAKADLTAERLKALLHYEPETGFFVWIHGTRGREIGKAANHKNALGYIAIRVDGTSYLAHRLAWLYVFSTWPAKNIDHIDGNRSNNAITNLRDVDQSSNVFNRHGAQSNNSHGFMGVSKKKNKWRARIVYRGARTELGVFDSAEMAHAAYLAKRQELLRSELQAP